MTDQDGVTTKVGTSSPSSSPQKQSKWVTHLLPTLFLRLLVLSAIYIPYTKVEESFYTQAIHDVVFTLKDVPQSLLTSVNRLFSFVASRATTTTTWPSLFQHFDHLDFPGVVPRSSLPALVIGGLTRLLRLIFSLFNLTHLDWVSNKLYGPGAGKLIYLVIGKILFSSLMTHRVDREVDLTRFYTL